MNNEYNIKNLEWGAETLPAERNRVLRNTYALLALSMVPTVAGAWLGLYLPVMQALRGGVGLLVFLAGAFGFMFAIEKNKNRAAGVPILLAFTFFMGLMLSRLVGAVLGLTNGAQLIMTAMSGTPWLVAYDFAFEKLACHTPGVTALLEAVRDFSSVAVCPAHRGRIVVAATRIVRTLFMFPPSVVFRYVAMP